ncbi:DUF4232 domain-containing protein [Streptosporangium carneum]|uniref:DUF4232 domain-containing protein n=1 Tax=Streptosporangium carneum TaxID=47481 RepID=UPI0022F2E838|nr:DUF4232 domain-containing protein [Streptosporangium carneum]
MISLMTAGVLAAVTACAPSAQPGTADAAASPWPTQRPATGEAGPGGTGTRPAGAAFAGAALSAGSAGKSAAGRCRTEGLRASVGAEGAGAGQRYAPLVLTNTSAKDCWVYGFVGLVMFDGNGDALRTRVRRESVRPRRVTLRPGASAHARLHWSVVRGKGETPCPAPARLMIIPPDEVAHLEIPFTAVVCGDGRLDITPMAAGARL